jgi:RimJ/RimL family protein N-acetyltransferase
MDVIIHTELEDRRSVCIRAIRPTDGERMRHGIEQLSIQSRYLRFFSAQPVPPDHVIQKLIDVDGHRHIAWGAIYSDAAEHPAIGAVHVVRDDVSNSAGEFAVAIVDAYQGVGLASMLTAVLLINCKWEGITSLDVQIMSENRAAGQLVRSLGGKHCGTEFSVADYVLDVSNALDILKNQTEKTGLQDIFSTLHDFM